MVDEVYDAREVAAMADIGCRGVSMVATVHGTSLHTLLENCTLNGLIGGKHEVLVGDHEARFVSIPDSPCQLPCMARVTQLVAAVWYTLVSDLRSHRKL